MKRVTTLIAAVLLTVMVWAQSPEMLSYQAVVRDASNALVKNQSVGMRISILEGSSSGVSVYTETQAATTNLNGLVSVEIGAGTTSDDFSSIDWSSDIYFIKTETDPTGGTAYTISGTTQLMSVPYALYAKTSGSSIPGPKGDTGEQGIQGVVGPKGDAGEKGDQGETGLLPDGSVAGNTPYWNGSSWVTNNSNLHNNGGNIGIGTSNPTSAKLVINTTAGAPALDLSTTDGYANMRVIQNTNGASDKDLYLGYNSGTNSSLHLYSNNGETMTVKGGNVGIGQSAPGIPLNFANVLGDKISLYGNSGNTYGFGIQAGLLQIHSDAITTDVAIGYGSSAAFTENMRIKGNGNVGIGTASPNEKFEVVGSSLRAAFRSAAENQDVTIFMGTPFNATAKNKTAIIADAQSTFSRSNLHFCLNGTADNTTEVGINDSKMNIDYNGTVSIGSGNQFQVNASGNVTKINNVATSFPSSQGAASTYLQNDGSGNLSWGVGTAGPQGATGPTGATGPAGPAGADGSSTFKYQFASFSNSSCCNNRAHDGGQIAAGAVIFANSTQPKYAYGDPLSKSVEVVEIKYLLKFSDFNPSGSDVLTIQPAIASLDGTLDRQLTGTIDLRTAAQNVWVTLPLSSTIAADNLVDAASAQYIVWEQKTTMSGGGAIDGSIFFDVTVKEVE